jgi:Domain of Unknown Function with PDB structure (DUF3857)
LTQFLFIFARLVVGCLIVICNNVSVAGAERTNNPQFSPIPSWVKTVPIPEFKQANLKTHLNGEGWLLSDIQMRQRPGGDEQFLHLASKVIDRTGLESSSNLTISHDPTRQTISINKLLVLRGGATIDHKTDARIDTFRKETNIQNGTLTGHLQTSILIPDVRVGDIVELAYTVDTIEVVSNLPFDRSFALAFNTPVEQIYRRILWSEANPLAIRTFMSDVRPVIQKSGTDLEYVWDIRNSAPEEYETFLAPGKQQQVEVVVSSAASWKQLVDLMIPYYDPKVALPTELVSRLDSIAKKFPNKADQLTEALRIAQDELRYVSLLIGPSALIARKPIEVYAKGYGDCKDKALFLAAMLNHLGIIAHVALTNLDQGPGIIDQPPSVGAFDHAIVRAELAGSTLWLDATDFSQGGRGPEIPQAHYGYALPLKRGAEAPEKIPPAQLSSPTQSTTETYAFPLTADGDLLVDVETIYTNISADQYRRDLASQGQAKLSKVYFDYYSKRLPNLEVAAALVIDDNRDKNEIKVHEKYRIQKFDYKMLEIGKEFPITGLLGLNKLPEIPDGNRKNPLYIGAPFHFQHVVVAKNLNSTFSSQDPPEAISPWFDFSSTYKNKDQTFELTWRLKSNGGIAQAADLPRLKTAISELSDRTDRLYNFAFQDEPSKELGPIKDPMLVVSLVLVLSIIVAIVLNWKPPAHHYTACSFQPVGLGKFLTMSILTGGLYNFFWSWNGFRQQKIVNKSFGFPLIQGIIHQILAFNILNIVTAGRLHSLSKQLKLVLIGSTTIYFAAAVWDISNIFYETLDFTNPYIRLSFEVGLSFAIALFLLPIVSQANAANAEELAMAKSNSKFSQYDILAAAVFFPLLLLSTTMRFLGY